MIQFPDKIKITISIITAQKPSVLSKQFTLADDGTLQKQPGGVLVEGTATRRTLSVTEFSALLAELKPSQALHSACVSTTWRGLSLRKTFQRQPANFPLLQGTENTSPGRTDPACS